MKVIGLTGGIGSGKSTISKYIEEKGIPVIDADKIAREIVGPESDGLQAIIERYGEEYLLDDGTLDRGKMAALVFNHPEKLQELNSLLHPIIRKEITRRIDSYKDDSNCSLVVLDAALLIEAEMTDLVDYIWLVYADLDKQIERVMNRDGFGYEEALSRIRAQMSLEQKRKYAHEIIDNSGNIDKALSEVQKLLIKYS